MQIQQNRENDTEKQQKKIQDKDVNKDYHKITQGIIKSFPKAKNPQKQ